jgi:cell wall-associated NlpC family hydrolase
MQESALKPSLAGDDGNGVEAALAESTTPARRLVPRRLKVAGAIAAACALVVLAVSLLGGSGDGSRSAATAAAEPASQPAGIPDAIAKRAPDATANKPLKSHPKVVVAVPPGEAPPAADGTTPSSSYSRPPSDAEVRSELTAFREHLTGFGVARGPVSETRSDGTAVAPLEAPDVVATVIAAGNEIATKPYKWCGGHGAWKDSGYDCSGSVSFALAGAGLLGGPLTSGGLMHYGKAGPGRWITIYANNGHVFMVVAGLRFDTSGAQGGTRWQPPDGRSYGGFTARHPPGL